MWGGALRRRPRDELVATVRESCLAAVRGLAVGLLAAIANPILFALFVLSLALIAVLGLGFATLPVVVSLLRWRTNLTRRLAGWSGVPIARP
jgi:hypothetical protein